MVYANFHIKTLLNNMVYKNSITIEIRIVKKNLPADRYLDALRASPLGEKLDLASLFLLSDRAEICPLQDPFRIRARYLGWKTASLLLDEKGELKQDMLKELLHSLASAPFLLIAGRDGDEMLFRHLLSSLQTLQDDPVLWKLLKKCSPPLANKTAEAIVRDTLWPDEFKTIQTKEVRRAALTAYLTLLRQTIGSCFATAPAILVQGKNPHGLVQDLEILLSAGQLRRGSYIVPMNPGSGVGELLKPLGGLPPHFSPGLQAAFHAVGLRLDDFLTHIDANQTPRQIIASALKKRFGITDEDLEAERSSQAAQYGIMWEKGRAHFEAMSLRAKKIREFEQGVAQAERAFCSLADCALLRCWEYTIASFSDVKVEFARWNLYVSLGLHPDMPHHGIGSGLLERIQKKLDQLNIEIATLDAAHRQAVGQVHLTESLLRSGDARRHQLQGEMAAAVQAVSNLAQMFDDAVKKAEWLSQLFPALIQGAIEKLQTSFQEVFDPALGRRQESLEDSPAGFRLLYKHGRTAAAGWERIENEAAFVDSVVRFFESLEREWAVEGQYREFFTALMTELIQYIRSDDFIQGALRRAKENQTTKNGLPWAYESGGTMQTLVQSYFGILPPEFSRPIRSAQELCSFLQEASSLLKGKGPFLMHSPTHAFLFYPAWLKPQTPSKKFWQEMKISPDQADFLGDRFAARLPELQRPLFHYGFRQRQSSALLMDLRMGLLLGAQAVKEIKDEAVDSFLYESLPVFSAEEARPILERFVQSIGKKALIDEMEPFLTSSELIVKMKKLLLISGIHPFSPVDWEMKIAQFARAESLSFPQPLLFGDTNWSDWFFGFVPHLQTGELQLWRLNRTLLRGIPMGEWDHVFREGGAWTILQGILPIC
jgi:hypothetical protein